jgi:tRNA(Ser,Leu) C12 N-acetylase TAN1
VEDWNVVVTVPGSAYRRAIELLQAFGEVRETGYHNVITLRVPDPAAFPALLLEASEHRRAVGEVVARAVPIVRAFAFQSPEAFEQAACEAVAPWLRRLAGSSFHVRMHRRGFRGRIRSQHEEQFLDHWLIEQLNSRGKAGRITFDDPDFIIALETVGQRGGVSVWDRGERKRFAFLKLD